MFTTGQIFPNIQVHSCNHWTKRNWNSIRRSSIHKQDQVYLEHFSALKKSLHTALYKYSASCFWACNPAPSIILQTCYCQSTNDYVDQYWAQDSSLQNSTLQASLSHLVFWYGSLTSYSDHLREFLTRTNFPASSMGMPWRTVFNAH